MRSCRHLPRFQCRPFQIALYPIRVPEQDHSNTLRDVDSKRHLARKTRGNAYFPGHAAEDSIRRILEDGVDAGIEVNSASRSGSLELQGLSSATLIYKPTFVTVKPKSEVIGKEVASVGARIRSIRKAAGKSQADFGRIFNVTQAAISNWEKDVDLPSPKFLNQMIAMTTDSDLQDYFRREVGLNVLPGSGYEPPAHGMRDVVLLRDSVAAGTPRALDENMIDRIMRLPRDWFPSGGELYALRVQGDSMAPIINTGYTVIVDTSQREPKKLINRMVAARADDGVTVKWLREDSGVLLLVPQSQEHPVKILKQSEDMGIVGAVVKWIGEPPPARRSK